MPHHELYKKIFAGDTDNSNPKDLLQNIVDEYPYFSLAHFFLLKETPPTDFNYRKVAAKTALHFNNPFLLKYQLNKKWKNVSEVSEVSKVDIVQSVDMVVDVEEIPVVSEVSEVSKVDIVQSVDMVADVEEIPVVSEISQVQNVQTVNDDKKKEELLFEPLHTTDYFASQGIKLSEAVQTGDKLGKQLKSFTDWLKTMKKVQHGKLPEASPHIDLAVQSLAEKSNKEQEVLTESMAEVYIRQGKIGKANDIYKKLSLLNPAKSAYFAAKIELLKEN